MHGRRLELHRCKSHDLFRTGSHVGFRVEEQTFWVGDAPSAKQTATKQTRVRSTPLGVWNSSRTCNRPFSKHSQGGQSRVGGWRKLGLSYEQKHASGSLRPTVQLLLATEARVHWRRFLH